MQIAAGSIFQNSESYIDRYARQISELRAAAPEHTFRLILAEGDGDDHSFEILKALYDGSVQKKVHGGPLFTSVEDDVRFRQVSWVWESILGRVTPQDDVFIWIESDLVWEPKTILRLLQRLEEPGVDAVSPMCFYHGFHYDTWAFRGLDGVRFGNYPPYHTCMLENSPNGLYPISGFGSCIVMKAEIARTCHLDPPELVSISLCRQAMEKGYRAWIDPSLKVVHP